jgi:diacylglycerol kinase
MQRIKRLAKSFKYAIKGLFKTYREEQNLVIQSVVGFLVFIFAWFLGLSRYDWIMLIFIVTLVILMELANSAVERVVDLMKPRIDIYVKEIKDIMAALVMIASFVSVVVGILIFWPYLMELFRY